MSNNPCPKCGQERIVEKIWVEEITTTGGISKLTHTYMICPDPICQAKVVKELDVLEQKRQSLQKAKDQRDQDRLDQLNKSRAASKIE